MCGSRALEDACCAPKRSTSPSSSHDQWSTTKGNDVGYCRYVCYWEETPRVAVVGAERERWKTPLLAAYPKGAPLHLPLVIGGRRRERDMAALGLCQAKGSDRATRKQGSEAASLKRRKNHIGKMNRDPPAAPPPPPPPPPHPPGIRLDPTDIELVQYFLRHKVLDLPFDEEKIMEMDIYSFHADDLTTFSFTLVVMRAVDFEGPDGKYALFFVRRDASQQRQRIRRTPHGYWSEVGVEEAIRDESSNVIVALKKYFVFFEGNNETRWEMDEYRLNQEIEGMRNTIDPGRNEYVVAKVFMRISRYSSDLSFSSEEAQLIDSDEADSSMADKRRRRS
ncbi:hypothetical protein GW17_00039007 [Ensete ventricosum]|nr:hypothetical protein GW17_00039007 [Ensete ventricosum]